VKAGLAEMRERIMSQYSKQSQQLSR